MVAGGGGGVLAAAGRVVAAEQPAAAAGAVAAAERRSVAPLLAPPLARPPLAGAASSWGCISAEETRARRTRRPTLPRWFGAKNVRNVFVMQSGNKTGAVQQNEWLTADGRRATIGPELGIGNFVANYTDATDNPHVLLLKSCIGRFSGCTARYPTEQIRRKALPGLVSVAARRRLTEATCERMMCTGDSIDAEEAHL